MFMEGDSFADIHPTLPTPPYIFVQLLTMLFHVSQEQHSRHYHHQVNVLPQHRCHLPLSSVVIILFSDTFYACGPG